MAKRPPVTVLVVDDHRVFAEALAIAIGLERGVTVRVATSCPEAIELAGTLRPDIVLMDLEMPGMGGLAAIREVRLAHPGATVLVVSGHDDDLSRARALEAGAVGYVSKLSSIDEITAAVRRAQTGEPLVEGDEAGRLMRLLRHRRHQEATERQRVNRLTPRQVEILQLMAGGESPAEIARQLGMSPLTLRTHIQNILTRLGVHTKLDAVALAIKHGKISVSHVGGVPAVDG